MQNDDFYWFVEHYDDLFKKYGKSYLAIKNKTILGVYNSLDTGIKKTSETEPLGTFIVQDCNGDESAYTAYINCFQ